MNMGLKHIYTGEGKGKTTAAIGLTIRAIGRDKKVIFSQFMKGRSSGERCVLEELAGVQTYFLEHDFGFYFQMSQEDKEELTRQHDEILHAILEQIHQGACDLLVMDEVVYAYKYKLMDLSLFEEIYLNAKGVEIVLTGRDPDEKLLEHADYITEMNPVKHPMEQGIGAREGIEY
ncbi:MAG: cob(I)yrinic acid a,c-diamide adenosyltransferase [Lachnospiraceae bacterium]